MTDPISSSSWTGPPDDPRAFTHRYGQHQITSDFARIAAAQAEAEQGSRTWAPERKSLTRWAAALLFSPLLLLLGYSIVQRSTRDFIGQDNSGYLLLWGLAIVSLALWQLFSRSTSLIGIRKALIGTALLATILLSVGYVYVATRAHASAVAAISPERTYELYFSKGSRRIRRTVVYHQRADGTLLEGGYLAPVQYAGTCTLAQHLTGEYGFTWVRVLDRSRARGQGELNWPIRREECFSDIPLSSLPR